MIEEDIKDIKESLQMLFIELTELKHYIIPTKKDNSKQSAKAQELVNKGKKPRRQPKKRYIGSFKKDIGYT